MLFYFYKITNNINNRFYYGVHRTKNINDGYMGSGLALNRAYEKYGIENFTKEILMFFDNEKDMYDYEEYIVNESLLLNKKCYNLIIGGRSSRPMKSCSDIARLRMKKDKNKKEEWIRKIKETSKKYWNSKEGLIKRAYVIKKNKEYWSTGDVEAKKKRHSESMKRSYREKPERREKIRRAMLKHWNGKSSIENREKQKKCMRNSRKFQDYVKRMRKEDKNKGYDNWDFKDRWEKVYLEDHKEICNYLLYTNLPDNFIINNLFDKGVKSNRLIKYYETVGLLPKPLSIKNKARFLRFENKDNKGHKDGVSKKTLYMKEPLCKIVYLYDDFFKQFEEIKELNKNLEISDSMIVQGEYKNIVPNFNQVIEYFEKIGLVTNKRKVKIKVWKTVKDKTFQLRTSKTVFDIGVKSKDVYLVDKELNEYEIDKNGRPFLKGRFELQRSIEEHDV